MAVNHKVIKEMKRWWDRLRLHYCYVVMVLMNIELESPYHPSNGRQPAKHKLTCLRGVPNDAACCCGAEVCVLDLLADERPGTLIVVTCTCRTESKELQQYNPTPLSSRRKSGDAARAFKACSRRSLRAGVSSWYTFGKE